MAPYVDQPVKKTPGLSERTPLLTSKSHPVLSTNYNTANSPTNGNQKIQSNVPGSPTNGDQKLQIDAGANGHHQNVHDLEAGDATQVKCKCRGSLFSIGFIGLIFIGGMTVASYLLNQYDHEWPTNTPFELIDRRSWRAAESQPKIRNSRSETRSRVEDQARKSGRESSTGHRETPDQENRIDTRKTRDQTPLFQEDLVDLLLEEVSVDLDEELAPSGLDQEIVYPSQLDTEILQPSDSDDKMLNKSGLDQMIPNQSGKDTKISNPSGFEGKILNQSGLDANLLNQTELDQKIPNQSELHTKILNPSGLDEQMIPNQSGFDAKILNPSEQKILNSSSGLDTKLVNPSQSDHMILNPSEFDAKTLNPSGLEQQILNPSGLDAKILKPSADSDGTAGARKNVEDGAKKRWKKSVGVASHVIVAHTQGRSCSNTEDCQEIVRQMQDESMNELGLLDIPYNFLIGGDGHTYEGRGWTGHDALRHSLKRKTTISLAFIGDFNYQKPPKKQLEEAKAFIIESIRRRKLTPHYHLVGLRQINNNTKSPGDALMRELTGWRHWRACSKNEC